MAASLQMKTLVTDLLKDDENDVLRTKFHNDPDGLMTTSGVNIAKERAILFSMDREMIGDWTGLQAEIAAYQMDSDWDDQGTDWKHDPEIDEPPDGGVWQPIVRPFDPDEPLCEPDDRAATTSRGGWSDPKPHGRGFRPSKASISDPAADKTILTLVGEGYLGSATVFIRGKDAGGHVVDHPVPVAAVIFKNFRRVYIRTAEFSIVDWHPGRYQIFVQNDAAEDICSIRAGHFFKVKA
jgi:hypothetical protein